MSATKLTRREQRAQAQHFIDTLEGTAFPNSKGGGFKALTAPH